MYYSTRVRAYIAWDRNESLRRVGDGFSPSGGRSGIEINSSAVLPKRYVMSRLLGNKKCCMYFFLLQN